MICFESVIDHIKRNLIKRHSFDIVFSYLYNYNYKIVLYSISDGRNYSIKLLYKTYLLIHKQFYADRNCPENY